MKSVSDCFEKDHDRLDAHFAEFQKLKRADFPTAKANFKQFMSLLHEPSQHGMIPRTRARTRVRGNEAHGLQL